MLVHALLCEKSIYGSLTGNAIRGVLLWCGRCNVQTCRTSILKSPGLCSILQGIQHLGSAMGCFMRMKGINFHDIDTAPATQSTGTVTGSQDGCNASVLPAIIQSEAVSISPVVLCPAATSTGTDVPNSNKRQKVEDSIAKAVSRSRQSTSGNPHQESK